MRRETNLTTAFKNPSIACNVRLPKCSEVITGDVHKVAEILLEFMSGNRIWFLDISSQYVGKKFHRTANSIFIPVAY